MCFYPASKVPWSNTKYVGASDRGLALNPDMRKHGRDLTPLSGPVRHLKLSRKYTVGIALRPHVRWFAAAGFVRQGRA